MDTNDFFIERDDSEKKKPKTTAFETKKNKIDNEPKTTIFSKSDNSNKKPSYEFTSPTEIIQPKEPVIPKTQNQPPPVSPSTPSTSSYYNQPNETHRPIVNASISSRVRRNEGFITGVLVSFSKNPNGEYWILRQGKNTIGSDRSNNIMLMERNISDQHAVLKIRRSRRDNRLMFYIDDMCSEVGTLVNGEDIEFTSTELSLGDKIVIGGYELLFLSFDKDKQELKTNTSFDTGQIPQPKQWQPHDYAAGDLMDENDTTQISS